MARRGTTSDCSTLELTYCLSQKQIPLFQKVKHPQLALQPENSIGQVFSQRAVLTPPTSSMASAIVKLQTLCILHQQSIFSSRA